MPKISDNYSHARCVLTEGEFMIVWAILFATFIVLLPKTAKVIYARTKLLFIKRRLRDPKVAAKFKEETLKMIEKLQEEDEQNED